MLSVLRRFAIVIAIAIAFLFGLATTVYLSLRSPEVKVPDVLGKDRFAAENDLKDAGLNFRVRATRPSNQVKADIVLFQLPRAGEVVKVGQTVAVDVSRTAKEGEAPEATPAEDKKDDNANDNKNANESPSANANSNKANRNKNSNKNANGNGNANANGNANNRNANTTRSNANADAGNKNADAPRNANSTTNSNRIENANRTSGNVNRRPAATTPTPPNH